MKRPQEAFCYQIPLTLSVVTFITAERVVPKSDFTLESARRHHWHCNRRKRGGRRQTSALIVAWEKEKWLREKENGLVLLPKPSLKLLSRWGRWGQTHSFQDVLIRFPCQMGKMKSSHQMTAKSALIFPPAPSSFLEQMRKSSPRAAEQAAHCHFPEQLRNGQIWFSFASISAQCLSMCCCLKNELLGSGTALPYVWKVCKEWEPANLYLHVSVIMLKIFSSWPEPTPSGMRRFCCIQSWVQRTFQRVYFPSLDAHHSLKFSLFLLFT